MRIVFVRHGEPDYINDCLTGTGKKQAEAVAERLVSEGIEEIYASPLGRAHETALITGEKLGLKVTTLDFMRELVWGSYDREHPYEDGHPWMIADEMAVKGLDLRAPGWRENPYFANNRVVANVDLVAKGIDEWLSGLGYERNGLYYDHKISEEKHKTIALFSHGGSSSAALAHMLNLSFPYVCALFHTDFTGITILRMDRKAGPSTLPVLELANDEKHIRE